MDGVVLNGKIWQPETARDPRENYLALNANTGFTAQPDTTPNAITGMWRFFEPKIFRYAVFALSKKPDGKFHEEDYFLIR